MSHDKRPTIEEQTAGMKQTLRKGRLECKLSPKTKPKCPPHSKLKSGERCPACGHHKI